MSGYYFGPIRVVCRRSKCVNTDKRMSSTSPLSNGEFLSLEYSTTVNEKCVYANLHTVQYSLGVSFGKNQTSFLLTRNSAE
mmetsp:Transcript_621/g.689  ORF Transcript_621/g.689 Transcript_621/m.689 type:complete len:81 (-) Transcript_621:1069-1311(-)